MKKSVYYSGALIMITAFFFLLTQNDKGMFIVQLFAAIAIMLCYPKCKEKHHFIIVVSFSIWVAAFDIIYIFLFFTKSENTFVGSGLSLFLQFGIPFIISIIFKALNDKYESKK